MLGTSSGISCMSNGMGSLVYNVLLAVYNFCVYSRFVGMCPLIFIPNKTHDSGD